MKIRICYQASEAKRADALAADIKRRLPNASVKRSDRHPPYRHLYISESTSSTCVFGKNVVK